MPVFATSDLLILRAVAQRGSFTAAARELGYTQSAISRRAAVLEATAGRPLFLRRPGGVGLTDAGEMLLRHATVALGALDAATRELQGEPNPRSEPVRLGAFASAAAGLVPRRYAHWLTHDPTCGSPARGHHGRHGPRAACRDSRHGGRDVDAAVPASGRSRAPLATEVLAEGDLLVAVGPRHRLAGRSEVDLAELAGERWIAARSKATSTCSACGPVCPAGLTLPSSSATG